MRLDKTDAPFSGPVYVACEGAADQYFLCRLLAHHQIVGVDVASVGGNLDTFTKHLLGLRVAADFKKLKALIIVTDNDLAPAQRFAAAQQSLLGASLLAPSAPWALEQQQGQISTGVVMLPGPGRVGTLETLFVEALAVARPTFVPCLDQLRDCAVVPMTWDEVKLAKMRFHAAIAALCEDGPGTAASRIWSATHNPIPIDSGGFAPLADFLRFVALTPSTQ